MKKLRTTLTASLLLCTHALAIELKSEPNIIFITGSEETKVLPPLSL